MIARILVLFGAGLISFVVQMTVTVMTQSTHVGILTAGICAFSMGIAASRDGIWRD